MRVKQSFLIFVVALFGLSNTFCGVRGSPMPPEKPPELGRGRPSYRRAVKGMPQSQKPSLMKKNNSNEGEAEDAK